jgi:hypothetical protein
VSQQGDGFETEVVSQPLQVLDLRGDANIVRPHACGRSAAAALVVVDQANVVGEPVQLG